MSGASFQSGIIKVRGAHNVPQIAYKVSYSSMM